MLSRYVYLKVKPTKPFSFLFSGTRSDPDLVLRYLSDLRPPLCAYTSVKLPSSLLLIPFRSTIVVTASSRGSKTPYDPHPLRLKR